MKILFAVLALGVLGFAGANVQRLPEEALSMAPALAAIAVLLVLVVPSLVRPQRTLRDVLDL